MELSLTERHALCATLRETGWARFERPASTALCDRLRAAAKEADWSTLEGETHRLDSAPLDDSSAADALGADDLRLVRHAAGQAGLPPAPDASPRFVLDLNRGWRSPQGGLLMYRDGVAIRGWRPVPGALTLFDRDHPLILAVVTPLATEPRLAVTGRLLEG